MSNFSFLIFIYHFSAPRAEQHRGRREHVAGDFPLQVGSLLAGRVYIVVLADVVCHMPQFVLYGVVSLSRIRGFSNENDGQMFLEVREREPRVFLR